MILSEPLDEREVQDLHTRYHELEAICDWQAEAMALTGEARLDFHRRIAELEAEREALVKVQGSQHRRITELEAENDRLERLTLREMEIRSQAEARTAELEAENLRLLQTGGEG